AGHAGPRQPEHGAAGLPGDGVDGLGGDAAWPGYVHCERAGAARVDKGRDGRRSRATVRQRDAGAGVFAAGDFWSGPSAPLRWEKGAPTARTLTAARPREAMPAMVTLTAMAKPTAPAAPTERRAEPVSGGSRGNQGYHGGDADDEDGGD